MYATDRAPVSTTFSEGDIGDCFERCANARGDGPPSVGRCAGTLCERAAAAVKVSGFFSDE